MTYMARGMLPTIPQRAKWFGVEIHDGRDWLRCDDKAEDEKGKKKGKPVRWWPVSTAPTPEWIGERWGSGWFRITWTAHDKRKTLTVSDPFAVIDSEDPNLANMLATLDARGGRAADHNLLNPEQVMALPPHMVPSGAEVRCTHCGRTDGETPMATFQTMFLLLNTHLDRQAKLLQHQHEVHLEQIRADSRVHVEQVRLFYQHMHSMSLSPRLAALESRLAEMYDEEDGEIDMSNATNVAILAGLAKELGPGLVMLGQNYLESRKKGLTGGANGSSKPNKEE